MPARIGVMALFQSLGALGGHLFPWFWYAACVTERAPQADTRDLVSFDLRRNLINVLGDDHYPYAEFLYHELAANAYDEDAQRVEIVERVVEPGRRGIPSSYDIVVSDDGNGMDRERLDEWFRVGESTKPQRMTSERLGRPLIGQIGVGKVSILKVARRWTIATERHLGLTAPVRLEVDVDVDAWISGEVDAFAVRDLSPTGRAGTVITLEGVHARLREDRILRMIQRLPLGEGFMVWRNGQPIPPRQWTGVDRIDIDQVVAWSDAGRDREGRLHGQIWIRPEMRKRRDQAFIEEPKSEQDAFNREPAGIEVRVKGDTIVHDFFGHETYGHGVNRIWGWVEADWLPILGNRTGYLRDHPAGEAFFDVMRPLFAEAFGRIRYENETRAQERRARAAAARARAQLSGEDAGAEGDADDALTTQGDETGPTATDLDEPQETDELLASRYAESINQILNDKPELAPVIDVEAERSRGRPAKDRIYPIRPSGERVPFETHPYGSEIAIANEDEHARVRRARAGSLLRSAPADALDDETGIGQLERGDRVVNTTAGVRLRFVPLGVLEAPYVWALDNPRELTLDINTEHKLYGQVGRPGSALHRLHCAWLVSLALAERNMPSAGRLADYLETLSYELILAWSSPRRPG